MIKYFNSLKNNWIKSSHFYMNEIRLNCSEMRSFFICRYWKKKSSHLLHSKLHIHQWVLIICNIIALKHVSKWVEQYIILPVSNNFHNLQQIEKPKTTTTLFLMILFVEMECLFSRYANAAASWNVSLFISLCSMLIAI